MVVKPTQWGYDSDPRAQHSWWTPYADTSASAGGDAGTPWRNQEGSANQISTSQAPKVEQVDPGSHQGPTPRGSVEVSIDRKRQAEELPQWTPESKEVSMPWRKPRRHVYGYRQRDYAAEAEILKEQEDLANRGEA